MVHGFAGGTYDEEALANYLELESKFDVYTFTLPGHDNVFNKKITKEDWIKKAEDTLNMLIDNGYKKIYVVGHSMGGIIACYLASKYSQIKKLVLAAPAFESVIYQDGDLKIMDTIKKSPNIMKTYKSSEVIARVFKLPLNMVTEFIELEKQYAHIAYNIKTPTMIIHGTKDQIVPLESSEKIFTMLDSKIKKLYIVKNVSHDIYRGNRKEEMFKITKEFLKYRQKDTAKTINM